MKKLIEEIDKYVRRVPALPENIKELLVDFTPWIAILSVAVAIPNVLSILAISSYYGVHGREDYFFAHWGIRFTLIVVFLVANLVLRSLSIKGLFAKSEKGWNYLFYSILLYFVYAIFTFNIVGGSIGTAISLYLIFQIRESYK
ncbi:MAG: hypothetical protein ABIJ82_03395 [Patescibacteria group bacterium]